MEDNLATVRSIGRAPEPLAFVVAGRGDLTEAAVRSNLADLLGAPPVAEDGYLSDECAREPYPILVVTGDTAPAGMVLVYEWLQWAAIPYTLVVEQTVAGKAADDLIRDAKDVHQVLNPNAGLAKVILLTKSNQRAGREVRLVGLGEPTREDIAYYGLVEFALGQGIVTEDLTEARHPIALPAETPPVEEEVKPTRRRRTSATAVKGEAPKVLKPVQQPLLFTGTDDEPQPHPGMVPFDLVTAIPKTYIHDGPRPLCPVCQTPGRATDHIEISSDDGFTKSMPTEYACPNGHEPQPHPAPVQSDRRWVVERMTKPQRVTELPKDATINPALVAWLRDTPAEEVKAAFIAAVETMLGEAA